MKKRDNSGFTLLELLGVMGVIVVMSFFVVSGYKSIMQGVNDATGAKGLRDSVQLARQHAMLDNSKVFFLVTGYNSYVMCREGGVITDSGSGSVVVPYLDNKSENAFWVYDEWADWESLKDSFTSIYGKDSIKDLINNKSSSSKYKGITMYDLDEGTYARVVFPPFINSSKDMWCIGFHNSDVKNNMFEIGNTYGWMLYEERYLPKGYIFDSKHYKLDSDGVFKVGSGDIICFNPDGTIEGGARYVDSLTIGEVDGTKADSIKNTVAIVVDGDGSIEVK
jgi:type II secretory pathway pseudopilin PulG